MNQINELVELIHANKTLYLKALSLREEFSNQFTDRLVHNARVVYVDSLQLLVSALVEKGTTTADQKNMVTVAELFY